VLDALLHEPRSSGRVLYVNSGDERLSHALEASVRSTTVG